MKRIVSLLCLSLIAACSAFAERIRDAQTELKTQGFYYGEVTGKESQELTAAIRRYQIRNGLEVTGQLDQATVASLGIGGTVSRTSPAPVVRPSPPAVASRPAATPRPKPPVHLRREQSVEESDREFLDREAAREPREADVRPPAPVERSRIPPPAPLDDDPLERNSEGFAELFFGTPYASAPPAVQAQTLRNAQTLMARRGYYRDRIDGRPGPATEEAVLTFQRSAGLPLSGRLDLQTLSELRLLPGRASNPPVRRFDSREDRPTRVYRGIWIE